METVQIRWPKLDYYSHVIKVMTVPAEYDEKARHIMRTCAFEAGIINTLNSESLEFTSERKNICCADINRIGSIINMLIIFFLNS